MMKQEMRVLDNIYPQEVVNVFRKKSIHHLISLACHKLNFQPGALLFSYSLKSFLLQRFRNGKD